MYFTHIIFARLAELFVYCTVHNVYNKIYIHVVPSWIIVGGGGRGEMGRGGGGTGQFSSFYFYFIREIPTIKILLPDIALAKI